MNTITHVVAAATNNAIGKDGQLLWHLPNDLKFFKNTTWGMPVIMGRKTFESVNKALPGRTNIVITRQQNWKAEGVIVVKNLQEAYTVAASTNCKEWFIIGGGEIYLQSLPDTNRVWLTRVHTSILGDTYYPELKLDEWKLMESTSFEADEKNAWPYTFEKWERI